LKTDARSVVTQLLPHRTPIRHTADAFAPANIALCKYWGKRNEALKLPLTGSLSISLGDLGTRMRIQLAEKDHLIINDEEQSTESKAFWRLFDFFNLFREPDTFFKVESINTIPMSAGLASSASAFACAVNGLNDLYGWGLGNRERSILSRLGSGSASRSICDGFVEWNCGTREDGMDSYAAPLPVVWPEFRIGILTLSSDKKAVGSSEGMQRTVETSTLYKSWPTQVKKDLPMIRQAIEDHDFTTLGTRAEQNALSMHATMISAWPPILYWQPESIETLKQVHVLRKDGVEVFATMDAGPNVKLLFLDQDTGDIRNVFPELQLVEPFATVTD